MRKGETHVPLEKMIASTSAAYLPDDFMVRLPPLEHETVLRIAWEEKSNEAAEPAHRFARKTMPVFGFRCILCGLIEFYAIEG